MKLRLGRRRGRRILALVAFRDEMGFLPGLFENLAAHVDGVVALDDQSTDESAEYVASQPLVVELLRVEPGSQAPLEEAHNRRTLTEAAWAHDADWLLGIDPDERVEREFRGSCGTRPTAFAPTGSGASSARRACSAPRRTITSTTAGFTPSGPRLLHPAAGPRPTSTSTTCG